MAKRESQGLQIALIAFVMVTVLFMVTTVLFWKQKDTATALADENQKLLETRSAELRTAQTENADIREKLLGYPRDKSYAEIEKEVTQILQAYGGDCAMNSETSWPCPNKWRRPCRRKTIGWCRPSTRKPT